MSQLMGSVVRARTSIVGGGDAEAVTSDVDSSLDQGRRGGWGWGQSGCRLE